MENPNLKFENNICDYDHIYLYAHLYHRNFGVFLRVNLPKQTFFIRVGPKESLIKSLYFSLYPSQSGFQNDPQFHV